MNELKSIWPGLGRGHESFPRNLSWTKKGPGRRHSRLPKRVVEAVNKMRAQGHQVDPTAINFS